MPSTVPATAIRFTDEDRAILADLQARTGLSMVGVIRLAIRQLAAGGTVPGRTRGITKQKKS